MKIKLNKSLKFVNNVDNDKTIGLSININCNFQDEKIINHIDNILSSIQFNGFKSNEDYKKEQQNIKEQQKQQDKYKKDLEHRNKIALKNKIKEQEKKMKEQEKLNKRYE